MLDDLLRLSEEKRIVDKVGLVQPGEKANGSEKQRGQRGGQYSGGRVIFLAGVGAVRSGATSECLFVSMFVFGVVSLIFQGRMEWEFG